MTDIQEQNQTQTTDDQRPDWLPEKFSTPEQLLESYQQLEQKLGSQAQQPRPPAEPINQTPPVNQVQSTEGVDLSSYYQEYVQNGSLSEESYGSLANQGYQREVVDQFIAGQGALATQFTNEIFGLVGGEDQFYKLQEWAEHNIPPEEQQRFNSAIDDGDMTAIRQAILSMKQRHDQGNPQRLSGSINTPGVEGFASPQAMMKAMQDERYEYDPGYRDEVRKRVEISNF